MTLLLLAGVTVDVQFGGLPPLVGTIAAESGLSGPEIGWVLNAMMVGSAISVSLSTRIGDIFGHRKVLIVLLGLALVGAALAATGGGFWALVTGRFLMGFAVPVPLSWGLLRPRATARQVRNVSLVLSLVMAIFTPLALVISGLVVQAGLPWQMVFWISFALFAILLILALIARETPASSLATGSLNWFGAIGLGVWVTALLVGISTGPSLGWSSPLVIGAFAISALTFISWVIQQKRSADPLISFRNMDRRQALVGYSGILLISLVGSGIFIVMPAVLQAPIESGYGHGLSTLDSTYVLLAQIPGAALGYFWTKWGLARLGPKVVLITSGIFSVVVYLGMAFANGPAWAPWLWVFGYGLATLSCLTAGYALVAAAGRQDNMAVTIGIQSIVQYTAGTVPTAIVLNVLVAGADGFIPEQALVGIFVAGAVVIAVFVAVWTVFAPTSIKDLHAVDTAVNTAKLQAANR
ncbi:MFS transporter [Microbacterium sp. cx-55]|uniref:MFS transporter n=1 Tax=unclassified Microbacterium TaxID=2609290 RepID=UPI001CBD15EB|nr:MULTISPECIES: MFS transporter [unclassified Microbacterium]MBZ4486768.1 MFS transporter [Microbacterium sp. cx-55]MCC4907745.1 MFS transporter [Microbacterium sp. cx-59]UGB36276.1 MFS transporter [Microbacterium sp. cx-55]